MPGPVAFPLVLPVLERGFTIARGQRLGFLAVEYPNILGAGGLDAGLRVCSFMVLEYLVSKPGPVLEPNH